MLNSFRKIILSIVIVLVAVGCEEVTTSGTGYVLGDRTSGNADFGNLLKITTSKTSQYVEVKFEGNIGSASEGMNAIHIPIWYKDENQYYYCTIFASDGFGTDDPEIGTVASLSNGAPSGRSEDTYVGNPIDSTITDIFSRNDTSEKTFGCELINELGSVKIKAYYNGVLKSTYVVGSETNHSGDGVTPDTGIADAALNGKPGIGFNHHWGKLQINSYAVYDKKPSL